ncbi:MAG: hypothetical protein ACREQQ_08600 [Candidatus Binatia bacterium]
MARRPVSSPLRRKADGDDRWTVAWADEPLDELDEVALTEFSKGAASAFRP